MLPGTALVMSCGLVSAAVAFAVGNVFRPKLLMSLEARPRLQEKFGKVDRAISRGGFKAMLLLRVVPTPLPFINYLYGITSIDFSSYILATALGYIPGTVGIVYSGAAGKTLLSGVPSKQPWYVYLGVLAVGGGVIKLFGETTKNILDELTAPDAGEGAENR